MEIKFIILRDNQGRLRHFKSEFLHHSQIAEHNGFNCRDILEQGIFLSEQIYILECINEKHLLKHKDHYIGNSLNVYQDLRLQNWLRGRELESQLYYSKKAIGLKEGD